MLSKLRGKRTYIVGALMLLTAAGLWLTGDLSSTDATRQILEALSFMGLRAGLNGSPLTAEPLLTTLESFRTPPAAPLPDQIKADIADDIETTLKVVWHETADESELPGMAATLYRRILARMEATA